MIKKAALLAAGDGTRLLTISPFKPIVPVNGIPLLELTLKNLQFNQFNKISLIFNENEKAMDLTLLPSLKTLNIDYFFKATISSMHSLFEVSQKLEIKTGEHFFVSMIDSILRPKEAQEFHKFCTSLNFDESAIIVTSFIEDEKPLTLKADQNGYITEFQCAIDDDVLITSGVYYFSSDVLPLLDEMILAGQTKMRNFLTELVKRNHKIKIFKIAKTLDVDRPEDIVSAEKYLLENDYDFKS